MSDNTGAEYIKGVFKEAENSFDAINTVQQDNKVRISSMQPALPILDLHGITRAEIHNSLFQKMQENLLVKVDRLETRGLTKLLDRCFRYIGEEESLRQVCFRIMQKLPHIQEKYLLHIADNAELYSACPLEVKRQIWQNNQGLFGEAVSPLLDQYIAEKESMMFSSPEASKKSTLFLSLVPKVRRQSRIVQELVTMIGTSYPLYTTLLQFLRTLFLRTQISHYCTLKADILMSLHEKESKICDTDRCHKFAWCLDACVRVGNIDGKKSRELFTFLEGIDGGDEVLGDVSMLLRDPYAIHVICSSILQCLQRLSEHSKLPRESTELECLVRLLQLGLKSLTIIDTKEYYEDRLNVEMIVKFLPELLSFLVENSLRAVHRQLKQEYSPHTPSPHFITYLSKHTSAMFVACTYAITLLEKKDYKSLLQVLPHVAKGYAKGDDVSFSDTFLHSLVHHMSSQQESMKDSTLQQILREFWLPCCQSETVLLHLCRLMWSLHGKISTTLLTEVLEEMSPGEESSQVAHEQYQTLVQHVRSSIMTTH